MRKGGKMVKRGWRKERKYGDKIWDDIRMEEGKEEYPVFL